MAIVRHGNGIPECTEHGTLAVFETVNGKGCWHCPKCLEERRAEDKRFAEAREYRASQHAEIRDKLEALGIDPTGLRDFLAGLP